jgi:hypothetical protein
VEKCLLAQRKKGRARLEPEAEIRADGALAVDFNERYVVQRV